MVMDRDGRRQLVAAAEKALLDRYGSEHEQQWGRVSDPAGMMARVLGATGAHRDKSRPEASAADVLAALAQMESARERLDNLELNLIESARRLGASWSQVAEHLGLATRQSAESRALRLRRGTTGAGRRDVAAQRVEQARQRAADAWSREHADRVRAVAEALVDTCAAWPRDTRGDAYFHLLAAALASGAGATELMGEVSSVAYRLRPFGGAAPEPSGPKAEAAAAAADQAVALRNEQRQARLAVTSAGREPRR